MSSRFLNKKAQTSIEYLLILAGVVLIVVIVGLLLKNVAQSSGTAVYCQEHPNDSACPRCGDGTCNSSEMSLTCPSDCPPTSPTTSPTTSPSQSPTASPSQTSSPTASPTTSPSQSPTASPSQTSSP